MILADFIERNPQWGIFASLTGLGTSILSALHAASIVLGFGGALFGVAAGFYTWRIKRLHWQRLQETIHNSKP